LAVMRQAIADRSKKPVAFYLVAAAWRRVRQAEDAKESAPYVEILPELLDGFAETRSQVVSAQFYERICAVAVLTDVDAATVRGGRAIHLDIAPGNVSSDAAWELIAGCLDLHNRALLHLAPKPRKICVSQVFNVITTLLSAFEATAAKNGRGGPTDKTWESLKDQLKRAHGYYLAAAVRSAQMRYSVGTMLGILPFVAALAILVIAGPGQLLDARDQELLAASLIAGAIGATISVMTRVTRKDGLQLENLEEANTTTLRVFGAIRPVVGAVFGAVVFLAVFSGMVPLELPAPSEDLFFFAAFGFAAGFSERLAKDTLSRVESTMPPTSVEATATSPTERLMP
jgi:hypothetical protein